MTVTTRRRSESAYIRQVWEVHTPLKTGLSAHRHTGRQTERQKWKQYIRQFHSVHLADIIKSFYLSYQICSVCVCITVCRTEPESADNTAEMVFSDDTEDLWHQRASVFPYTARHVLTRPTQECH